MYTRKALDISIEFDDAGSYCIAYRGLSYVEMYRGNFYQSEKYVMKALEKAVEYDLPVEQEKCYAHLSKLAIARHDFRTQRFFSAKADSIEKALGFEQSRNYGDESRLDMQQEIMIYRVMHELVSNALKHADASQILVQIVRDVDRITLTVNDNGCGFDVDAPVGGMGLANIRNRVDAFNGELMVYSKAGMGTEISVELKIEN